ncbi:MULTISPECIES: (2Fe-2S)-binding protein [Romboutsia]|uniref:Bacterioferritin-associated ferredoxin n=1 Tax=Romboutsia hominis TaxID=1507512 RepID=A0A2P2BP78_9FIRM|nr:MULTISPECIES: (2Fe-2S)-binding protein [Romboutsia]MCH1959197.1 (2Fe-2S)-binding protein [Romboutsia hominis]MCH1970097.1 (2Fe-2S)-binding protein [Romboutsia hominis]MDB8790312.1 (2Fe-2S)-binding protein [Romboutsia sp. 1001216sp1]MDB8792254.1 (2Fe-2S)-binding protein [Romboutsia sp. 1001216sp1]MDB8795548.1 (2Fe-2S)-binding protein [Romboutsia sp. 1001216sp1]
MENKTVCFCKQVKYLDIKKAIEEGAKTVEDIKNATGAATGCGRCVSSIEEILKEK